MEWNVSKNEQQRPRKENRTEHQVYSGRVRSVAEERKKRSTSNRRGGFIFNARQSRFILLVLIYARNKFTVGKVADESKRGVVLQLERQEL